MLDFFKTKGFHDTCENYCPDFVYDYFKNQGWWEHLFHKDFSEQLMDYVRENPATTALMAATLIGSTVVGSAFAIQKIRAKTENSDDKIKMVLNVQQNFNKAQSDTDTSSAESGFEAEEEIKEPVAKPKTLVTTTILNKVFAYLKAHTEEHHSVLAGALGISETNIDKFKKLPGFPKAPSIFATHVVNNPGEKSNALELLGLPRDGSYPEDDGHYLVLAEAIGMPSPKEDKGERVKVTF